MLSLEGNTAPYLLYAYTRIQSLITRSGRSERDLVKMVAPEDESERLLCVELIKLDDVVDQVAKDGYPHLLCNIYILLQPLSTNFTNNLQYLTSQKRQCCADFH